MSSDHSHRPAYEPASTIEGSIRKKTCVITGSSRGIGRAIALHLGHLGANVVVNYRSSETKATAVADEINAGEGDAITIQADVGDKSDVQAFADTVHREFGSIDALVNNAGVTADERFDRMTWEDWNRVLEVNLGGTFHCTKAFYEDVVEAENGRLINISSVIAERGNYGQSNYAASKSALFGFTRSLAHELAPHASTANCVAPGYTWTDMVKDVREDIREQILEDIPLDRFATPPEIASAVVYLASDNASYVTGEVLNVNGGLYG